MFRHVVFFRWKAGTSDADKQALRDGLAELPDVIAEIRRYEFGDDAGLSEDNFDFALVADFDDLDGFRRYMDAPAHLALIRDLLEPVISSRAAVQHEHG